MLAQDRIKSMLDEVRAARRLCVAGVGAGEAVETDERARAPCSRLAASSGRPGQLDGEDASSARDIAHVDRASVCFGPAASDEQTQTRPRPL